MGILQLKAPTTLDKMIELSNLSSPPFDNKTWYIEVLPCTSPTCICRNVTLLFRDWDEVNTSRYSFSIEGDLTTEKFTNLSFSSKEGNLSLLSKPTFLLEEVLAEEDWKILEDVYRLAKGILIDRVDLKKELVIFPHELRSNPSLAVSFLQIFPLASHYYLNLNETVACAVSDQYCSNYNCDCTNVCFNFLQDGKEELFSLWYDYKTEEIEIIDRYEKVVSLKEAHQYLEVLRTNFKGFNKKLEKRNQVMRHLYKKYVQQENKLLGSTDTKKKIGRNAPCPCGSGKKYKRCCGRRMR